MKDTELEKLKVNPKPPAFRRGQVHITWAQPVTFSQTANWRALFTWAVENWMVVSEQNEADAKCIALQGFQPPSFSPRLRSSAKLGMTLGWLIAVAKKLI